MTLTEYEKVKNQVVVSFGNCDRHNQILSVLKETFRDIINSPRRYEQISTIGQLLKVLEIRDFLSEYNVQPLREIANKLPNNNGILQSINNYQQSCVPPHLMNYYTAESTQTLPERKQANSFSSNDTGNKKKQRIIETVIADIDTFWRDLARNLNIKEKYIDEINESCTNSNSKAKQIMDLFLDKADQKTWFYDLCEALELSRRKDLAKRLKNISVMNI